MSEWTLPLMLIALTAFAAVGRRWLVAGTALALFANWAACDGVVRLTDDDYPVLFMVVADYATAIGIFVMRRSHWQSAIMGVYAVQLVCHAAYALSSMGVTQTYYSYWALTYMAWVQVALIGGWLGTDLIGGWLPILSSRRDEAHASAVVAGEEK